MPKHEVMSCHVKPFQTALNKSLSYNQGISVTIYLSSNFVSRLFRRLYIMLPISLPIVISYLCQGILAFTLYEFVKRKFMSPGKPLVTCLIDAALRLPSVLRLGPYGRSNDINEAVTQAIRDTGLSDFTIPKKSKVTPSDSSTEKFIERYSVARNIGLERSGCRYSPSGYVLALNTLKKRFEIRLRMVEYIKKHPQVMNVEFHHPPIFAIGFPRTGTTFLHELLGLHPEVQMHYTWEQMSPVPLSDDASSPFDLEEDRKKRYAANEGRMKVFIFISYISSLFSLF